MQALYEADLGGANVPQSLEYLFEQHDFPKDTRDFALTLAVSAWKKKSVLDELIKKYAKEWSLERISGVDRSILRLALFELLEKETPKQVVINEAIELAKKYSTDEASKFINGILGSFVKDEGAA